MAEGPNMAVFETMTEDELARKRQSLLAVLQRLDSLYKATFEFAEDLASAHLWEVSSVAADLEELAAMANRVERNNMELKVGIRKVQRDLRCGSLRPESWRRREGWHWPREDPMGVFPPSGDADGVIDLRVPE